MASFDLEVTQSHIRVNALSLWPLWRERWQPLHTFSLKWRLKWSCNSYECAHIRTKDHRITYSKPVFSTLSTAEKSVGVSSVRGLVSSFMLHCMNACYSNFNTPSAVFIYSLLDRWRTNSSRLLSGTVKKTFYEVVDRLGTHNVVSPLQYISRF